MEKNSLFGRNDNNMEIEKIYHASVNDIKREYFYLRDLQT